jgi:Na+-driven multidrug efflux pump
LGYVVFAALVSGMGTTIFAAHSIAVTAETIFYIPGYGLRSATSTMVGQSLGEENRSRFDTICRESIVVTVVMMCCTGVLLFATALPLMRLFTPSEAVAQLGARMLRLVAFSEPFFGLMVVVEGVFYGLGRTRYAFWVETGSMWGVRILFSYLCVRVWGLDLQAVWLCMIADNVCKALLFTCPVASSRRRDALFAPRSSFSGKGEKTQKNA